ncbi:2,5-dichloro-2,5-cyclohexadiene-1,4-diol dehydrogenase-like [Dysidea avara]|uniref:2,5-dichloro-2,5-cyclohexadiene-1,4-diol dehydrogenase-like n=1 Tax=Dysidea avara TaxID=196820 RepID=UPI0033168584
MIYVCGDVSSVEDVKKSVQRGVDEFGGIDILLHCAAAITEGRLQETDDELFKKTQDVNIYGTFLMMKYVSNKMIEAGKEGVIVNVSSVAVLVGIDAIFAYCASKFAVCGMTRAAAKSLAKHSIRVCAVAPSILEGHTLENNLDVIVKMNGVQGKEQARTAMIQSLQASGVGSMRCNTASPPASQKDILQAIQDQDTGVKVQDVTLKTIQTKSFSGVLYLVHTLVMYIKICERSFEVLLLFADMF